MVAPSMEAALLGLDETRETMPEIWQVGQSCTRVPVYAQKHVQSHAYSAQTLKLSFEVPEGSGTLSRLCSADS